jgi:hypothetical protein
MTPLAGLIAAIAAGWFVRDPRRAVLTVIPAFLAVLAIQTAGIAAGDGTSPPSTVLSYPGALSYWLVQVIILAPVLIIAAELGALRAWPAGPDGAGGAGGSGRRAVIVAAVLLLVAGVFDALEAMRAAPVRQHSSQGSPPAYGVAGILLLVVLLVVFSALLLRRRRAARRQQPAGGQPDAVPAGGPRQQAG